MARTVSVKFNTRPFVASHMREPKGRGSWAFALSDKPGAEPFFSPSMTYSEAKDWAAFQARLMVPQGAVVVWLDVLP